MIEKGGDRELYTYRVIGVRLKVGTRLAFFTGFRFRKFDPESSGPKSSAVMSKVFC